MDPDELDEAVTTLQQQQLGLQKDLDTLRTAYDRTAEAFDQLSQKLRYPGTKFLVDLEYKLVYEGTTTIGAGVVVVTPVFETLPGKLHAVYALSAYAPSNTTDVIITDGSVIVAPANSVTVAIQRQQQATPTRMEMRVVLDNAGGGSVDIAVRVWRRLGMGS